jgi:hypothetical protein
MSDHDVAVIDTASLTVTYLDRLMNLCIALAVNPASGFVSVVGTEATNEVRFEPNVKGTFVRSMLALVNPAAPGTPGLVDMNGHLTYATPTVPQADRDRSLADPRGIAWNAAGTRAYVTGMGSNNVVVLGANGARAGLAPTIEVGEGPTGIVLDEPRQRLYVLNKFDASISLVDTTTELEQRDDQVSLPTPAAGKRREDRDRGILSRHHIGEGHTHFRGRTVRRARDRHPPALGLHHGVVTGARGVGAESGDGAPDEPRVLREELAHAQRVALERAGAKVLDHDVGIADQRRKKGTIRLAREVGDRAQLVPIRREEVRALAARIERRTPAASLVAASRTLDLDDIGPEIAEDHRGERAGQNPRKVENFESM